MSTPYTPPVYIPTPANQSPVIQLFRDAMGRTCAVLPPDVQNPDFLSGGPVGNGYAFDFATSDDGGKTFTRHPINCFTLGTAGRTDPLAHSLPPRGFYVSRLSNAPRLVQPSFILPATGSGEHSEDWPKTNQGFIVLAPDNPNAAPQNTTWHIDPAFATIAPTQDSDTLAFGILPPHREEPGHVCAWFYSNHGTQYNYGLSTPLLRWAHSYDNGLSWPTQYVTELGTQLYGYFGFGGEHASFDNPQSTGKGWFYPASDYPNYRVSRRLASYTNANQEAAAANYTGPTVGSPVTNAKVAAPAWKPAWKPTQQFPDFYGTWAQVTQFPNLRTAWEQTDRFIPATSCWGDSPNVLYVAGFCNDNFYSYPAGLPTGPNSAYPYVARSTDGGRSWEPAANIPDTATENTPVLRLVQDKNGNELFGSYSYGPGWYGLRPAFYGSDGYARSPVYSVPPVRMLFAQGTLYLAIYNNAQWLLMASGDNGMTWERRTSPPLLFSVFSDAQNKLSDLCLAPNNHRLLWNCSHHSDDDGQTWAAN